MNLEVMPHVYLDKNLELHSLFYRIFHLYGLEPSFEKENHSHEFYHMNFILSGSVQVITEKETPLVTGGNAFIAPPGVAHALCSTEGYLQIGVDINPVADPDGYYALFSNTFQTDEVSVVSIHNFNATYEELFHHCSTFSVLNTLEIINIIQHMMLLTVKNTFPHENKVFRQQFFQMLSNCDPFNLPLTKMCEYLNVSSSHLGRLCKAEFGCSPIEYCNNLRLMKAKRYLETTTLTMQEIAEHLAFYSSSHFVTFFKSRTATTPSKYREIYSCRYL